MANGPDEPTDVQKLRRDLENLLEEGYRFLARGSWRSFQDWLFASVSSSAGRKRLTSLLEFPQTLDADSLVHLLGSPSHFSQTTLALAARRLFYFLRPYREIMRWVYAPPSFKEMAPPLHSLLDACEGYAFAEPLTWDTLWSKLGNLPDNGDEDDKVRILSERLLQTDLQPYITQAVDGRDFSILEAVTRWRFRCIASVAKGTRPEAFEYVWPIRKKALLSWLTKIVRAWNTAESEEEQTHPEERRALETAWWSLETAIWLSSAQSDCPNGQPSVASDDLRRISDLCKHTEELLQEIKLSGQRALLESPRDSRYRTRVTATPEVFNDDRTVLFAGINAMRIAWRLRLSQIRYLEQINAEQYPSDAEAAHPEMQVLEEVDKLVTKCLGRILQLRDNGHLWWVQQRLLFVYEWIDYHRVKNSLDILPASPAAGGPVRCIRSLPDVEKTGVSYSYGPELYDVITSVASELKKRLLSWKQGARIRNRNMSVVFLAEPGTGKSVLVKSLAGYLKQELDGVVGQFAEKKLQHLKSDNALIKFLETAMRPVATEPNNTNQKPAQDQRLPVVFIDELHLEQRYNQYAELLSVLEDNTILCADDEGKQGEDRVGVVIFATSQYFDQWEFLREARKHGNRAMIDFHSRIAVWQSIPQLELIPSQRVAVYLAERHTQEFEKPLVWWQALWIAVTHHADLTTGRGISIAAVSHEAFIATARAEMNSRFGIATHDWDGACAET